MDNTGKEATFPIPRASDIWYRPFKRGHNRGRSSQMCSELCAFTFEYYTEILYFITRGNLLTLQHIYWQRCATFYY